MLANLDNVKPDKARTALLDGVIMFLKTFLDQLDLREKVKLYESEN